MKQAIFLLVKVWRNRLHFRWNTAMLIYTQLMIISYPQSNNLL